MTGSLRVGVIHNLTAGGAHRRLHEQLAHLEADVIEVCLATATPVSADARVVALSPRAPRAPRALRPALRYGDLGALVGAWRRAARELAAARVDVVYANPCRYLQAPAALLYDLPPALYFCDEPRRVDHDPAAAASRSAITRPVYGPLYAAQRTLDRRAVGRARALITNSAFTAAQIRRVYGRIADIVPLGVAGVFGAASPRAPAHVLSVGALIASKGHELVIAAAARAARRWPVVVVSPRPDGDHAARLQASARRHAVDLHIRVAISDRELADCYASAVATVYAAAGEPLGLASLEAQAAGSPVIVAAEGGLPETIVAQRTGWAVPRRADAIARHLDRLADPGLRDAMSSAARAHAAAMGWERSSRAVGERLEALCDW